MLSRKGIVPPVGLASTLDDRAAVVTTPVALLARWHSDAERAGERGDALLRRPVARQAQALERGARERLGEQLALAAARDGQRRPPGGAADLGQPRALLVEDGEGELDRFL